MYCLKPLTITPAMLTSSIAEVDAGETEWVSGATYALADVRTYSTRKYERKVPGAGTITPDLDPTNWRDVGPTNRHAMFDTLRNTQSTAASTITVSIVPGQRISAIALMRCAASSVTVSVIVGGMTMYAVTRSMLGRSPVNWTGYFFGNFRGIPALLLFDLPPYSAATITITITNSVAAVKIGALCLSVPVYVGVAQHNAISSALNFSEIERNPFGDVTMTPRRSVPSTNQITWVAKAAVDSLLELREDTNAVPCVWSALDDKSTHDYFNAFLILGFYREFVIDASNDTMAKITFQIEEV